VSSELHDLSNLSSGQQSLRVALNNNNSNNNNNNKYMLVDVAILGEINVIKKEAEKILKYKDLTIRNTTHVVCKNKSDTSNNKRDWDHFKVIYKTYEQHTRKSRS